MEDLLMFTDIQKFNEEIARHSIHMDKLNAILMAYGVMNLSTLTGTEFIELVNHPGKVVFDKMTNGQPFEINGMQIDKTKAIELILKPAGYKEMIELIEGFKQIPNWSYHLIEVDVVNGEVVLNQSVIDKETEASKVYAKTDKEKQLFQFVQGVVAAANAAFGEGSPYNLAQLVEKTIYTLATPTGTFEMPLPHYSYEIRYRKIVGFESTENSGRW